MTTAAKNLPSSRAYFPPEDIDWVANQVRSCLDNDEFRSSEHIEAFETAFATRVGAAHAVAVASGTAALEATLRSIGVGAGEVLVPTNTFVATAAAAHAAGARPVFVDMDDATLAPTLDMVASAVTTETRAVMMVHMGGIISPEMPAIRALCHEREIPLVEDAAQAVGATLDGTPPGAFGVAATFSFYSTKVIMAGEGGMVTTSSERLAEDVRAWRDHGRRDSVGHAFYATNARMPAISAIVGRVQLARLEDILTARAAIGRRYTERLAHHPVLRPMMPPSGAQPSWYKYWVHLPDHLDRDQLRRRVLARHGIDLPGGVQDIPCHLQPAAASHGRQTVLPNAEHFCAHHVCLPIYPSLDADDVDRVLDAVVLEVQRA